jgi:hypothetical protein
MLRALMEPREENAQQEAEVWAEFETALSRIPQERLSDPGVLGGTWTVIEMLHHVTGWIRECSRHLAAIAAGTFVAPEETDEITDARNAAFAEQARAMDVSQVRAALDAARDEVLRRWAELPEIDDAAIEWFAGETYEHYEEHLPDLDRASGV